MQPFDALTLRAVLQEAKPLLINKRVDKILQLGRDELLISLRSKGGNINIFLSAHSASARICLVAISSNEENSFDRYQTKEKFRNQPKFGMILKKILYAATLVGVEQMPGDRVVDFVFSCVDEVGTTSLKILSAELMGRHSNLIFWDKESKAILAASHVVTKEMSRQREILPRGTYERPPSPDKANIFLISKDDLQNRVDKLSADCNYGSMSFQNWLLASFSGLGKNLAEEIVHACGLPNKIEKFDTKELSNLLWQKISQLQTMQTYRPLLRTDFSVYKVLGWNLNSDEWTEFNTVNDLVEHYYRELEVKEQFNQQKVRLLSEVESEKARLQNRRSTADEHTVKQDELMKLKESGDLILAHLTSIKMGQSELTLDQGSITINPLLSGVQNAQHYYRLYAKGRARIATAESVMSEIESRLEFLLKVEKSLHEAQTQSDLKAAKNILTPKIQTQRAGSHSQNKERNLSHHGNKKERTGGKKRLLTLTSQDGWKIFAGRNRHENSHLLSIANQYDIWLHIQGQSGSHVLIRVPSTKQDPPKSTLIEAAQIAARLSRVPAGAKVTVVYTQCRYVKNLDKNKPGQVRYENEKTLIVDTSVAMPDLMKRLFSQ